MGRWASYGRLSEGVAKCMISEVFFPEKKFRICVLIFLAVHDAMHRVAKLLKEEEPLSKRDA